MSKRAWMPLYVADFQMDTLDLSREELGVYTTMLCLAWHRDGPLPGDDNLKFMLKRLFPDFHGLTYNRIVPKLLNRYFYRDDEGNWRQKRVEKELRKAREISEKQSRNARERWEKSNSNEINQSLSECDGNASRARLLQSQSPSSSLCSEESSLRSESSVSEKPIRTRKRKTTNSRIEYPPDFERFWRGYPTDSNMSKAEALPEWEKLDAVDREAAERSLTGFRAYCSKNPDYRPIHANRYLKHRRFDGHISTNGHDGTAPALSEKDAAFRWWMDQGMSMEKAEERWEMILQRRQQHG